MGGGEDGTKEEHSENREAGKRKTKRIRAESAGVVKSNRKKAAKERQRVYLYTTASSPEQPAIFRDLRNES